ncbi:MAG: [FeFe] hydrogenase H-cluster radical SAM maturase HydG, partial [Candidatus Desulforudis sp.]|nr:[FeFe] hydrogenase H-cluster radical SAM maturase HydG [Desulforudis sp.]
MVLSLEELSWRARRLAMINDYQETERRVDFIDEAEIFRILRRKARPETAEVAEVLAGARVLKGLAPTEAAVLLNNKDPELLEQTFVTARWIKEQVYGNRIVLFAPLYVSSPCVNNCSYCGFRHTNRAVARRTFSLEELAQEVGVLTAQGHKRLIVVYGEHPVSDVEFMCRTIETVYATNKGRNEIRRVNVNASPLTV